MRGEKFEMEKNEIKMKTHGHCLLHATGSTGMVTVGPCSLEWLREGDWCDGPLIPSLTEGGQPAQLRE